MSSKNLVGAKDISTRAGVKVDTVHKWRDRHPSFPDPLAVISDSIPVWDWSQVALWLESRDVKTVRNSPAG